MKYKKLNMIGALTETLTENYKYKWIYVLALLDEGGSWLCTKYWKLNQKTRANQFLIEIGWKQIK